MGIVIKEIIKLPPLVMPIALEFRFEGVAVFQKGRECPSGELGNFSKFNIHLFHLSIPIFKADPLKRVGFGDIYRTGF